MMKGFLLLIMGGIFQGSFGIGYKKYPPFSWAVFWGIYNTFCALSAFAAALILSGGGWRGGFGTAPIICGALWGISAVAFSKAIIKIGMSMVYGISMGLSSIVGSLVPMIADGSFPEGAKLAWMIAGFVVTLAGTAVITAAGIRRDGGAKFSIVGILLAALSGFGSGAMNIGFNLTPEVAGAGAAVSAVRWLPVLLGGCAASVLWGIGEGAVNHEWHTAVERGCVKRLLILAGVSVIWYMALLLYGVSVEMLGGELSSLCWILFNSLALIVSGVWGVMSGEWRNSKKDLLFIGMAILIIAWIITARSM